MLIVLQRGLESEDGADERFIQCMDNLLLVIGEGKHVLVAPRKVINWLGRLQKLRHRRNTLEEIQKRAFERHAWRNNVLLKEALPSSLQKSLERWISAKQLFPNGRYLDMKEGDDSLPGLGEHLRHVAEYLKGRSDEKIAELLFPPDDETWEELGHLLFSWGCATRKVRLS